MRFSGGYGEIADALAAVDITLAAKVLWLFLKIEWVRGTNAISAVWNTWWGKLQKFGIEAWGGFAAAFVYIGHGLEVAWIETTSFLSKTWTRFT